MKVTTTMALVEQVAAVPRITEGPTLLLGLREVKTLFKITRVTTLSKVAEPEDMRIMEEALRVVENHRIGTIMGVELLMESPSEVAVVATKGTIQNRVSRGI